MHLEYTKECISYLCPHVDLLFFLSFSPSSSPLVTHSLAVVRLFDQQDGASIISFFLPTTTFTQYALALYVIVVVFPHTQTHARISFFFFLFYPLAIPSSPFFEQGKTSLCRFFLSKKKSISDKKTKKMCDVKMTY